MRNRRQLIRRIVHSSFKLPVIGVVLMLAAASSQLNAQEDTGRYERSDIEFGARLFGANCVACHGENGDLQPEINLLSGYFPNSPSDRDLGNNIRDGLPGTAMVPTDYTDSEITALVAYVRNIGSVDLGSITLGDSVRGQTLYEGKGDCGGCHRIFGRGPRFAPELSNIGAIRTAAQLERSLLGTEGSMVPINRPVRAVTRDGTVINGRRLNEDTFTVQLVDDQERLVSLEKAELREYTILTTSPMPAYEQTLTDDERADLLAYLLTLKGLN